MYVYYSFGYNSDFNNFKTFLSDVKQRQIYNYKSAPVEITIKVSPANIERFKFLGSDWSAFSTDLPVSVSDDTAVYYDNETNDYYTMDKRYYPKNNDGESETNTNIGKDNATDMAEAVYEDVNE
jgi:hypothetical protein